MATAVYEPVDGNVTLMETVLDAPAFNADVLVDPLSEVEQFMELFWRLMATLKPLPVEPLPLF